MMISLSTYKPTPPLVTFPGGLINVDQRIIPRQRRKEKVVVVIGATGTGKSRLSIDLATLFNAEVINSDKMQVYKGLDIATNKVTEEECGGVPHHLIGIAHPEADFWAHDFVKHASAAADAITKRGRLPIIAGGSNSFIKALVNDDVEFRSRYDCCFLWVDVEINVLNSFVSKRVDRMVELGLVEEAAEFFDRGGDYGRGIRRAIGVPELDEYFRSGGEDRLLELAIDRIKANTKILAGRQRWNILRLLDYIDRRRIHRVDATEAFLKRGEDAWERTVKEPSRRIVDCFFQDSIDFVSAVTPSTAAASVIMGAASAAAVAAATH